MIVGNLRKMVSNLADTVEYQLPVGDELVPLNPLLGKELTLTFTGKINCAHCGALTKKSFSQGYCFPCMRKLARCDMCIMKPETCHYHEGTCREPEWGEANCFIPHYVYLSNTIGLESSKISNWISCFHSRRWILSYTKYTSCKKSTISTHRYNFII